MADENTQSILIRFRGLCTHIDLPKEESGGKRKRTVLARHLRTDMAIEHHVAHVEFYADDVATFSRELKVVRYTRPGADGTFARVDLDEPTEIRFKGIRPGIVNEEPSYRRGVVRFKDEILDPLSKPAPSNPIAPGLLVDDFKFFDTDRAMAVFDMPPGTLVGGEPEHLITHFEPFENGNEFSARRLARWTDLYATIDSKKPLVLELVSLRTGAIRTISFKKDLQMITIGNEPERLILGVLSDAARAGHLHGSDATRVQPSGHFIVYYGLLQDRQKEMPVPIPTQLGGAGCTNNNYP